jgi:hypothetical protein
MVPRASRRQQRAVVLIALAVVALAITGAVYLRPALLSQIRPSTSTLDVRQIAIGHFVIPTPPGPAVPRTAGLLHIYATSVRVQQFVGLNDNNSTALQPSVRSHDRAAISRLVRELNALPAYPFGVHCPMGDGAYFALDFSYSDGTSVAVTVEANGCTGVYVAGSPQPVAWALESPRLFVTIRELLAHSPPA